MTLNSFQLKIIAIILMTISHINYHLDINPWLYIGQGAFPIFAFLSAYSVSVSRDPRKYIGRLLFIGLLFQLPLWYLGFTYINIFVTLGLGSLAIYSLEKHWYPVLVPIFLIAYFTDLDYGVFGICLILSAYFVKYNKYYFVIALIILQFITINILNYYFVYQWLSLSAVPFILLYNYQPGYRGLKWFFYGYYPLHIIIIYYISIQ